MGWWDLGGQQAKISGYIANLPLGELVSNGFTSGKVIQMDANCSGLPFMNTEDSYTTLGWKRALKLM